VAQPPRSSIRDSRGRAVALSPGALRLSAGIATLGWTALVLQLAVTLQMMTADGQSAAQSVWRYLGYFTILTNLLVAVTMTRVAMRRWPGGTPADTSFLTGVVLAIAVVGLVYEVILSGRVPAMGPVWWTADRLLHYVVPALCVVWWLLFVPGEALGFRDPPRWLVYPVSYLIYSLLRGAIDGWYPYFFIDAGVIGYARALTNAAGLTVAMLLAGYVLVAVVRLGRGRHAGR
jgi:hypothetical protein